MLSSDLIQRQSEMKSEENSRPVELAELDQTELDIAGLVLREGLAELSNTPLDVVEGRILQFGDIDSTHREF